MKGRKPIGDEFEALLKEAVHEPPLLVPGTLLANDRFAINRIIGSGGMGVVYEARDRDRGVDVALKMLTKVDAPGIYRFKNEFRALAGVTHPNLVGLHELFQDRGSWFFTMDLVRGEKLNPSRFAAPEQGGLREVFGQLASGINAIHQAGKLHRDLKPGNAMISPEGRVVILDFGLVSDQPPGGAGQTVAGEGFSGTLVYTSPEQAGEEPASKASDWYAFGAMLYEALSGEPAFSGPALSMFKNKIAGTAIAPPSTIRDGVPGNLERLCMDLLSARPEKRPTYAAITAALTGNDAVLGEIVHTDEESFVGRAGDLTSLHEALNATDNGRPAVVILRGPSGIGKTRLAEWFLNEVRRGKKTVTLKGRCYDRESLHYKACDSLVDDLSRYLRQLPTERSAGMLPRHIHALAKLFPVFERLDAVNSIKQRLRLPAEPSELRRLGFNALKELLGNIAAQERLILFIDDLQWADVDGARLLTSVLEQPDAPALLLVGAHRSEEMGPGLDALLQKLADNTDLEVRFIDLEEFDMEESLLLARLLLPEHLLESAEKIAVEAGGNPFFINELARHAVTAGKMSEKVSFKSALKERIDNLTASAKEILSFLAVSAGPMSPRRIREVTGFPDVDCQLRELVSARMARRTGDGRGALDCYHDRIRETIVSSLGKASLGNWHRRFVEAIEKSEDGDLPALVHHLAGAGDMLRASEVAAKAGAEAAEMLAFEQAAKLFRLALEHGSWTDSERVGLVVSLAEALVDSGRSAEGGRTLLEAAQIEKDKERRLDLKLKGAEQLMAGGQLPIGVQLFKDIFREVGLDYDEICGSDTMELRTGLAKRGLGYMPRPESGIPREVIQKLDALDAAGTGLAWHRIESIKFRFVLTMEALDAGSPRHIADGLKTVARFDSQFLPDRNESYEVLKRLCSDRLEQSAADLVLARAHMGMALLAGRPGEQLKAAERAEEILLERPRRQAKELSQARFHQALALNLLSDHALLKTRSKPWIEDAVSREDAFLAGWLKTLVPECLLMRDRPDRARVNLEEVRGFREKLQDEDMSLIALFSVCKIALCDIYEDLPGGWSRVSALIHQFAKVTVSIPMLSMFFHHCRAVAALALARGRSDIDEILDAARSSIAALGDPRTPHGRPLDMPHWRTVSTVMSAGLSATEGDEREALTQIDKALDLIRDSGAKYPLIKAHLKRQRGLLLGGDSGAAEVSRAENELNRMGVVNIPRHARIVVPGFGR